MFNVQPFTSCGFKVLKIRIHIFIMFLYAESYLSLIFRSRPAGFMEVKLCNIQRKKGKVEDIQ